ncbi:hypothetical protein D3C76_855870 [compost metagenome]
MISIMEVPIRDVLNRKQRQQNADAVLNSIHPDQQDFNVMLLAFADIIQAKFYDFVRVQCESQAELRKREERMNEMIHQILEGFDKSTLDNAEDMIVLSTCMIEAINRALIRQQQNGVSIDPVLGRDSSAVADRDVRIRNGQVISTTHYE